MIQVEDLVKTYPVEGHPRFVALDHVSLSLPDSGFIALLGPSGCGKTTFLNLLGGLDSFDSGQIRVDGVSLKEMKPMELDAYRNSRIGFVFQSYYLFPDLDVESNIELPLTLRNVSRKERKRRADALLKELGLEALRNKKPKQLSGGQAQRIAIARALVTDPDVILADEPTGALDSVSSTTVMEILKKVSRERLVLMVTHNEELASKYADRILRMKDGKILSDVLQSSPSKAPRPPKPSIKSRLSFTSRWNLAWRSLWAKKWKPVMTSIANSFGMVGIAFFLALNNGFQEYSARISQETASSLPVVLTTYSQTTEKKDYSLYNASVLYPESKEIYPSVDAGTTTRVQYNNFSVRYLNYLDKLKAEGLISSVTTMYNQTITLHLATETPTSLDGTQEGGYSLVPADYSKIFLSLPESLSEYDILTGRTPENPHEVVLMVDKYNSIPFSTLKSLGYYHEKDTQKDVEDATLASKVKPISFSEALGKTYKIFPNDIYYSLDYTSQMTDDAKTTRTMKQYKEAGVESGSRLKANFYEENGTELTVVGILRPKKNQSPVTSGLYYLPSLVKEAVTDAANSKYAADLKNHMAFVLPDGKKVEDFLSSLSELKSELEQSEDGSFPLAELNQLLSDYFRYIVKLSEDGSSYSYYPGFGQFLSVAEKNGVELVPEEMKGVNLSDKTVLDGYLTQLENDFQSNPSQAYEDLIALVAYFNGASVVSSLFVYPKDLSTRRKLIEALNFFNEIQKGSIDHASSADEQVTFSSDNLDWRIEDVSGVMEVTRQILLLFVLVSMIVSVVMIGLMTSNNVLERKKAIGLLRALGARKSDIAALFLAESLVIGGVAGLFSSLLTYLFSFPLNRLINQAYPYYEIGRIAHFTGYHVLIVLAISLFVGALAALLPSLKAARENPVDCLREDS